MLKATQHSNVSLTKPRSIDSVIPPPGYTFVEESVARCSKIDGQHVPFLRSSAFGTFINVSGQELHTSVQNFAHESGIPVHNVYCGGRSPLTRNVSMFEEFVKSTLELLIHLSITSPVVLLIGSPSHSVECIIVACLRRVQQWSFVSILSELRMNSGCRQFDVEQFIENFDPDIIDISKNTPDFLKIHFRLKDEEEKLLQRLQDRQNSFNTPMGTHACDKEDSEGHDSDALLVKLFFSSKALSQGIQFDPSISLINDKDDDD